MSSFLSPAAAAEMVTVEPADIALLTCVLADHQRTAWTPAPDLAAALDHDGPVLVQACQLWLLLGEADPELVYDLDGAEDATHERMGRPSPPPPGGISVCAGAADRRRDERAGGREVYPPQRRGPRIPMTMAQVLPLAGGPTLADAATAFLNRRDLDADTLRSYRQTLNRLRTDLSDGALLADLKAEQTAAVFTAAWENAAARTWNRHRSALRSFTTWAAARWSMTDRAALVERRRENTDTTKVIDRHLIEALWQRRDLPLRDKTLFRLLYESAARSAEVLGLDVVDLVLEAKRGRVRRKGGAIDWILWQSGTARLLPRLLAGRTRGPVFLTDRRPGPARTPAAADLCPITSRARLSYERAEYLFKQATKDIDPTGDGYTLHQLRHSRLTHLGEDGWSASMLMTLSGHRNLRTLGIYVQPSTEAVAAALAEHDPGRRRR